MKKFAEFLKPQVNGAGTSVFSTKNLPRQKYIIPVDDENNYKNKERVWRFKKIQRFNCFQIIDGMI